MAGAHSDCSVAWMQINVLYHLLYIPYEAWIGFSIG